MFQLTELSAAIFALLLTIVSFYAGFKGVVVLFGRRPASRLKKLIYGLCLIALFILGMWVTGRVGQNMH